MTIGVVHISSDGHIRSPTVVRPYKPNELLRVLKDNCLTPSKLGYQVWFSYGLIHILSRVCSDDAGPGLS